jgi:hypothetical protein
MERRTRLSLMLPLAILLAGIVIPAVIGTGRGGPRPDAPGEAALVAGRTADQWRDVAFRSLEREQFDRALRAIKTAERAEPGTQFGDDLVRIRRARWEAREVERARRRLLGGEPEHIALDPRGAVLVGYRTTVVLPGESLWSLARQVVSAERGIHVDDVGSDDAAVYALWDRLTDLNGVRELEVGERVMVPLPDGERALIAAANARDLSRIERGTRALVEGDLDAGVQLHEEVRGEFARATDAFRAFEEALAGAREDALVDKASSAVEEALALSRSSEHGAIVGLLADARRALVEARGLSGGTRHGEEVERVDELLADAERFRVESDGSVFTTKPAGVAYTETARATVEWFLGRRLASSGREFPYYDEKTGDEIGWARYLGCASEMARLDGVDFATVLESVGEEIEIRLPSPGRYFSE